MNKGFYSVNVGLLKRIKYHQTIRHGAGKCFVGTAKSLMSKRPKDPSEFRALFYAEEHLVEVFFELVDKLGLLL